jgi:citrate:succinate antiporter/L-tartrate/succinate antiporter
MSADAPAAPTPPAPGARALIALGVWLAIWLSPAPAGLVPAQWHYFAVFAATISAMVFTALPGGAIGLCAIAFIATMRYVEPDAGGSIRWALSGFADPAVWLTFGAFLFALGYRATGLGRRLALTLVQRLGRRPLGLGYAIALADLVLAPGTPSNTARSGGTIYPIVRQIPLLYGCRPGSGTDPLGSYVMWTAFASTAVTSSLFITALVPNAAALALAARQTGIEIGWWRFVAGFAPAAALLLLIVPPLTLWLCRPPMHDSARTVAWAGEQLHEMGPMTRREWTMAGLIGLAVLLWVGGSNPRLAIPGLGADFIHPTTVVLVVVALMLVLQVVTWDEVLAERDAWGVLLYFTTVFTLADGLARVGFIGWLARAVSTPLIGADPTLAMLALVALFYWSHYLFASITSHAVVVLPVVLGIGGEIEGLPLGLLAMLCIHSLGLMGVLSPYATGCAPIYAASGYIGRARFWWLGLLFGALYFAVLIGVVGPWLLAIGPDH